MSLQEVFNDKEFLQKLEFFSKYPAITMQAYDADNKSWIDIPVEIYFEFQKDSLNIESDSIKVDNQ